MIGVGIVLGLLFALSGSPAVGLVVAVCWILAFPEARTLRWPRRQPRERSCAPTRWYWID